MINNHNLTNRLATWERNSTGSFIWYPMFYDCDSMLGLNLAQIKSTLIYGENPMNN